MLTDTPVNDGIARLLALKRDEVIAQNLRFVTQGDAESLHDLRVALRRLHSIFVAFSPAINPGTPLPQSLRELLKKTNHARDLEVTLAILVKSQVQLGWLVQHWHEELEQEYIRLRSILPETWQTLQPDLEHPDTLLNGVVLEQDLGHLSAHLLQLQLNALKEGRKSVCRKWRDKPAHKLRIIGKQTRYILEPFSEEIAVSCKAVTRLKDFQDLLGDYHDIVVLRTRLRQLEQSAGPQEKTQLEQARKHLKQQGIKLRQRFQKYYCGSKGRKLEKLLLKTRAALAKN